MKIIVPLYPCPKFEAIKVRLLVNFDSCHCWLGWLEDSKLEPFVFFYQDLNYLIGVSFEVFELSPHPQKLGLGHNFLIFQKAISHGYIFIFITIFNLYVLCHLFFRINVMINWIVFDNLLFLFIYLLLLLLLITFVFYHLFIWVVY